MSRIQDGKGSGRSAQTNTQSAKDQSIERNQASRCQTHPHDSREDQQQHDLRLAELQIFSPERRHRSGNGGVVHSGWQVVLGVNKRGLRQVDRKSGGRAI